MNIEKDICVCLCGILLYSSSFGMFNNNNNNNNDSQNNTGITFTWKKPIFRFGQISGVSLDDFDFSNRKISKNRSAAGTLLNSTISQNLPTSQSAVGPSFFQPQQRELSLLDCKYFIADKMRNVEYGYTDLPAFIEDVYLQSRIESSGMTGRWYTHYEGRLLIYVNSGIMISTSSMTYAHLSVYVNLDSVQGSLVKHKLGSGKNLDFNILKGLHVSKFSYGYECYQQIESHGTIPMRLLTTIYGDDYSPHNFQVKENL